MKKYDEHEQDDKDYFEFCESYSDWKVLLIALIFSILALIGAGTILNYIFVG